MVGISAGGRTAVTTAARHPDLVQRLILESSVAFLPWPERSLRLGAHLAFPALAEKATWSAVRTLLRLNPTIGLRTMLGGLSTEPIDAVLAALSDGDRATLIALFSTMRSGRGFLNDLHHVPDATSQVTQPTLIIASRKDGAVPFAHAQSLAAGIAHAEQIVSDADTHFIWFAHDYPAIADKITSFLAADPVVRG
ncbi:alpha/beta fold hydrolase [Nonomuraea endophytica]|uniref:alpha/beta fold hydrolase n=1 Tax=Nonomuraea endophytica TaxID=714136 RepID=UPI0037CB2C9D